MIYNNTDSRAIDAMERARTGNYGEDDYTEPRTCLLCDGCYAPIREGEKYWHIMTKYNDMVLCQYCIDDCEEIAEED